MCLDGRLGVRMTSLTTTHLNPTVEFQMRVFRFRDDSTNAKQQQEIKCELYLEENESTLEATECECFTAEECSALTTAPILASTTARPPTTTESSPPVIGKELMPFNLIITILVVKFEFLVFFRQYMSLFSLVIMDCVV